MPESRAVFARKIGKLIARLVSPQVLIRVASIRRGRTHTWHVKRVNNNDVTNALTISTGACVSVAPKCAFRR